MLLYYTKLLLCIVITTLPVYLVSNKDILQLVYASNYTNLVFFPILIITSAYYGNAGTVFLIIPITIFGVTEALIYFSTLKLIK